MLLCQLRPLPESIVLEPSLRSREDLLALFLEVLVEDEIQAHLSDEAGAAFEELGDLGICQPSVLEVCRMRAAEP